MHIPGGRLDERFWKALRCRASRKRLFLSLADLQRSLRAGLSHFQTVRSREPGTHVMARVGAHTDKGRYAIRRTKGVTWITVPWE